VSACTHTPQRHKRLRRGCASAWVPRTRAAGAAVNPPARASSTCSSAQRAARWQGGTHTCTERKRRAAASPGWASARALRGARATHPFTPRVVACRQQRQQLRAAAAPPRRAARAGRTQQREPRRDSGERSGERCARAQHARTRRLPARQRAAPPRSAVAPPRRRAQRSAGGELRARALRRGVASRRRRAHTPLSACAHHHARRLAASPRRAAPARRACAAEWGKGGARGGHQVKHRRQQNSA
jgi:hypothetical protein